MLIILAHVFYLLPYLLLITYHRLLCLIISLFALVSLIYVIFSYCVIHFTATSLTVFFLVLLGNSQQSSIAEAPSMRAMLFAHNQQVMSLRRFTSA